MKPETGLTKKVWGGECTALDETMGHPMAIQDQESVDDIFKVLKLTSW